MNKGKSYTLKASLFLSSVAVAMLGAGTVSANEVSETQQNTPVVLNGLQEASNLVENVDGEELVENQEADSNSDVVLYAGSDEEVNGEEASAEFDVEQILADIALVEQQMEEFEATWSKFLESEAEDVDAQEAIDFIESLESVLENSTNATQNLLDYIESEFGEEADPEVVGQLNVALVALNTYQQMVADFKQAIIDEITNSTQPEEPSTPSQPEEPSTPSQPEEPSTPTQPEEPSTPSQPEEPSTPSQPEEPSTPSQPEEPSTPSQPEEPSTPTQPEEPSTPTQPEEPSTSTQQKESTTPTQPVGPKEPTKPNKSVEVMQSKGELVQSVVKKENSENALPNTGTQESVAATVLGGAALIAMLSLVKSKRKKVM